MAAAGDLLAQQRALAALIRADDEVADGAPAVTALLRPPAAAPPRLGVYRHAYRARLVEALRSNYPVLHRVLGDDAFEALARDYLAAHPSRSPSIRWFGHALPAWLAARLEADPQALPHPALADLARMEWAVGSSFDAADAAPLARAALAARAPAHWPALRFAPHPSVHLVALGWAIEPLWRALTDDPQAQTNPPAPHGHHLLVWRAGLETRWRTLPADEAAALAACIGGLRFDELCARVAAAGGAADAAACVVGWLGGWVQAGLLVMGPEAGASGPGAA
jgi:hypothetical protein